MVVECSGSDWRTLTLIDGSITKDSSEQMETGKQAECLPELSADDLAIGYTDKYLQSTAARVGAGKVSMAARPRCRVCEFKLLPLLLYSDPFLSDIWQTSQQSFERR